MAYFINVESQEVYVKRVNDPKDKRRTIVEPTGNKKFLRKSKESLYHSMKECINYSLLILRYCCESKQIECQTANSTVDGLVLINIDNKFDLVLLDIAMPEFTGLDIIKYLKMRRLLGTTHLIIDTASSDPKLLNEVAKLKRTINKPYCC